MYAQAQSLDEAAAALGMTKSNVLMTLSILEREFDAELVEQARLPVWDQSCLRAPGIMLGHVQRAKPVWVI